MTHSAEMVKRETFRDGADMLLVHEPMNSDLATFHDGHTVTLAVDGSRPEPTRLGFIELAFQSFIKIVRPLGMKWVAVSIPPCVMLGTPAPARGVADSFVWATSNGADYRP